MAGMSNKTRNRDLNKPGHPTEFAGKDHSDPTDTLTAARVFEETNRARRGHIFLPKSANKWPRLRSPPDVPLQERKVVAHYFVGGCDWWVTEYDPQDHLAFGYADLGQGFGEWGYIDLAELERTTAGPGGWLVVERDCHWDVVTAREVIPAYMEPKTAA